MGTWDLLSKSALWHFECFVEKVDYKCSYLWIWETVVVLDQWISNLPWPIDQRFKLNIRYADTSWKPSRKCIARRSVNFLSSIYGSLCGPLEIPGWPRRESLFWILCMSKLSAVIYLSVYLTLHLSQCHVLMVNLFHFSLVPICEQLRKSCRLNHPVNSIASSQIFIRFVSLHKIDLINERFIYFWFIKDHKMCK